MPLQIGIVGLPNVGKSTLFRAITRKAVDCANFPFCTIDPNVGVVAVPDERLDQLARVSESESVIPTTIEFVDIAGLVRGAHKGEGLGNKFLANIRTVDAIAHVVRVFEDPNIVHIAGAIDPASDVATIDLELAMADLATVQRRIDALEGGAKSGDQESREQLAILREFEVQLNAGRPIRGMQRAAGNGQLARALQLLTAKPLISVLNVDEASVLHVDAATWRKRYAFLADAPFIVISAKIEAELADLSEDDARAMRGSLGMAESGLHRLIRAAYNLLDLLTYFTSGPKESRAWTVPRGTKAPQAAGVIHTDFEKGFIRAEVIDWADFIAHGEAKCKELGKMRLEGKEYEVRDGDTIYFRVAA